MIQAQHPQAASLKYKFVNNQQSGINQNAQNTNASFKQSRNNPMHKIKDFFIHNTYNASLGNTNSSIASQLLGITQNNSNAATQQMT